ncbi:ran GTPase-activating protein [Verticillium dahliae VdLs.17]|uniref:Ran GTPase-activating protein n=1 Tax=Verticillium dahliae (strain VdLs.17 / ATCC MYA-4575 / FGSC 10137) TaxID=498257 RepID=G2X294_VERDV|nr:ran GTPase-activating protein [Verticillium dahliae VdLs.17]EGY22980.1 ran GTPase-activating protein [Verticillium dahliae VdLs.17]
MATTLKLFSLEGKGLKLDTAEDLEAHIADLRANDVEEVKVLGNTFGIGACKLLGEVLAEKKNLQSADLSDMFTGRLLSEIPEALSSLLTSITNLPNLRTINLNDNAFGLNTQAPLVAFLAAHVPLQHLYLNNNGLASRPGPRPSGCTTRSRSSRWCRTASARRASGTFLSEGLVHAQGLRVLDLQDNTFTVQGARALAGVAPGWADLVELGVGDSYLTSKGGVLLAGALAKGRNAKLETLRLQYNEINAKALQGLVPAARDALPALKRIELNGNKFEEEDPAVIALRELLEERKEKLGGDVVVEDDWGLDSLSDLEEEDSDDEEVDDEEEEEELSTEKRAEILIKDAEEAQEEPVVQVKDKEVEALAKKLEKTGI